VIFDVKNEHTEEFTVLPYSSNRISLNLVTKQILYFYYYTII